VLNYKSAEAKASAVFKIHHCIGNCVSHVPISRFNWKSFSAQIKAHHTKYEESQQKQTANVVSKWYLASDT